MVTHDLEDLAGPTDEEMSALMDEEPLIEAGVNLLDAEIRLLLVYPEPTALDWHRMRRAEALVMREMVKFQRRRKAATGSRAA